MATETIFGHKLPPAQKAGRGAKPKPPTKTELKEQAAEQRKQELLALRQNLQNMLQDPAFQGGSLQRKEELISQWQQEKWNPQMEAISAVDPELASQYQLVKNEVIGTPGASGYTGALGQYRRQLDEDGGFFSDAAKLATASVHDGIAGLSTWVAGAAQDELDAQKARQEREARASNPTSRESISAIIEEYNQEVASGSAPKTVQLDRPAPAGQGFSFLPDGALASILPDGTLESVRQGALELAVESSEKSQAIRDTKSAAAKNIDQRAQELGGGFMDGTIAAFEQGVWPGMKYLALAPVESLPSIIITTAVSGGTALATRGKAAPNIAGITTSGVTAGASASGNRFQEIINTPREVIEKNEKYQQYIAAGYNHSTAVAKVAVEESEKAGLLSGVINSVLPLGGSQKVLSTGAQNIARRKAGQAVATTASKAKPTVLGATGRTAKAFAFDGTIDAIDALGANYLTAEFAGDYSKFWAGVGDAFIQGGSFGGAVKGASEVKGAVSYKPVDTGTRGESGTDVLSNLITDATSEEISRAAGEAGISVDSAQTVAETSPQYSRRVGTVIKSLDRSLRTALDKDELTGRDIRTIHGAIDRAIEQGVPPEIALEMEQRFDLVNRADYIPYTVAKERANETNAAKGVSPVDTIQSSEGVAAQPSPAQEAPTKHAKESSRLRYSDDEGVVGEQWIIRDDHVFELSENGGYAHKGHVLDVGFPEGSTQQLMAAEVDGAVVVGEPVQPEVETLVNNVSDEGSIGDPWIIRDNNLYEMVMPAKEGGKPTYRHVGVIGDVELPSNSTQTPLGQEHVQTLDEIEGPLSGLPMDSYENMNAELTLQDLVTAHNEAIETLEVARDMAKDIRTNIKTKSARGRKASLAHRDKQVQEIALVLANGLIPYYLAHGGDMSIMNKHLDSILPPGVSDKPLSQIVGESLQIVVEQANNEAAGVILAMTDQVSVASQIFPAEAGDAATNTLNKLLVTADVSEASQAYISDFQARMDAYPTTPSEIAMAQRNQTMAERSARKAYNKETRDRVDVIVADMEGTPRRADGTITDINFLRLAEALLDVFIDRPDAFMTLVRAVDNLEPTTKGRSNNLTSRLFKFYEAIDGRQRDKQRGSRSNQARLRINSLLETYSKRSVNGVATPDQSPVGGDSSTAIGGGLGGTSLENTGPLSQNAGVHGEAGTDGIAGSTERRSGSGYATGARKGTSESQRSSGGEGQQRTDSSGGYSSDRGVNKVVAPQTVTNLVTGEPELVTANGFSPTKLSQVTTKYSESLQGNEQLAQEIQVLDDLIERFNNTESLTERAEILREIDKAARRVYLSGAPNLDVDVANGPAHEAISKAIATELTPEDKAILNQMANIDPDYPSANAFLSEMTREAVVESGGDTPSKKYASLPERVKEIFRKIARAIGVGIVVMSTWSGLTHISDAPAMRGGVTIEMPVASETIAGFSDKANAVNKFVKDSKDNDGKPYIIADKNAGEIHIMSGDNKLIATAPALYGKSIGDNHTIGQTPAGAFNINVINAPSAYGGNVAKFSTTQSGDIFSIHRVLNVPGQDRQGRLMSPTTENTRISDGCINVPESFYDSFIEQGVASKVYIVPDTKSVSDVFSSQIAKAEAATTGHGENYSIPAKHTVSGYESSIIHKDDPTSTILKDAVNQLPPEELLQHKSVVKLDTTDNDTFSGWAAIFATTAALGLGASPVLRRRQTAKGGRKTVDKPVDYTAIGEEVSLHDIPLDPVVEDSIGNESSPSIAYPEVDHPMPAPTPSPIDLVEDVTWDSTLATGTLRDFDPSLVNEKKLSRFEKFKLGVAHFFADDVGTPMAEFLLSNVDIVQENVKQHPLMVAINTAENIKSNTLKQLNNKFVAPLIEMANDISKATGVDPRDALNLFSSWATLNHIEEANNALVNGWISERNILLEASKTEMNLNKNNKLMARVAELQDLIQLFEESQASGVPVEGARLAGGMTNAQAKLAMQKILDGSGIPHEQLREANTMITNAFSDILAEATKLGLIEDSVQLDIISNNFQNYVPLYVDKEAQQDSDAFRAANLGDVTKSRDGSTTTPMPAVDALLRYISAFSTSRSEIGLADAINNLHNQFKEAGDPSKISKVLISDSNATVPGITHFETTVLPDGSTSTKRYLLRFNDPKLNKALKITVDAPNTLNRIASTLTRGNARLMTALTPTFAWINAQRDIFERFSNTILRDYQNAEGERINTAKAAFKAMAYAVNPRALADVGRALAKGDYSTKYGKHLKELMDHGGLSLFSEQVYRGHEDIMKRLGQGAIGKTAELAKKGYQVYNDAPNAVPSLAQFMALRDQGVDPETAASIVLESMNFSKKGAITRGLEHYFPFINSAFQSGAALANNFGLGVGQKFFSKQTAKSLMKIGAGFVVMSLAATTAREELGFDEDTGQWVMDMLPLQTLRAAVPFFASREKREEGLYSKFMVGFGTSQVTWTWAVMLDRVARGEATVADFMKESVLTIVNNSLYDVTPGFDFKDDPFAFMAYSALPAVTRPFIEAAFGTGYFGNRTHYGSNDPFDQRTPKGTASTPPIYARMAENIKELTGFTVQPGQLQTLFNGYAVGPLTGVVKYMEEEGAYFNKHRRNTGISPFMYAVGANRYFGSTKNLTNPMYFNAAEQITTKLDAVGVDWISEDYKSGQKEQELLRRGRAAGLTNEQLADVSALYQVSKITDKLDTEAKNKVKALRKQGMDDEEYLEKVFLEYANKRDAYVKAFLNGYDKRRWQ
jgi:hypothetical protein